MFEYMIPKTDVPPRVMSLSEEEVQSLRDLLSYLGDEEREDWLAQRDQVDCVETLQLAADSQGHVYSAIARLTIALKRFDQK